MSDRATSSVNSQSARAAGKHETHSETEAELVRRFATQLAVVAQRNLGPYLRHKIEPEDITQSVFRTFFRRQRLGEFEFENWSGVWGLLVRLAVCKCRNRVTYLQAQRRDIRREYSLGVYERDNVNSAFELRDIRPFPDEQALVSEEFDRFLAELNDVDRAILAGHLAGYRSLAISVQVGSSEQTVRRRLLQMERKLRARLSLIESADRVCVTN